MAMSVAGLAQEASPFHQDPSKLVVTRGDQVVNTLPCERIELDGQGRWKNQHVRGHIGRTSDGTLYAVLGGAWGSFWIVAECKSVLFSSTDEGRTWTRQNVDLPDGRVIGSFIVLHDDSFLAAVGAPQEHRIEFFHSTDRGKTWKKISEVHAEPFNRVLLDGNLRQLRDGTILSLALYVVPSPDEQNFALGVYGQYVLRSTDSGKTWQGGPPSAFWKPLIESKLTITGSGPEARLPGPGGTFPGCYETSLAQLPNGTLLGAFRYSGAQQAWHKNVVKEWRGGAPDNAGRVFRQVMLSSSPDGGVTWTPLRPVADAQGQTLIVMLETNGELALLPDERLVLVHQRRFGERQNIARVSADGGKTWSPDEYRLSVGFGYSGTIALADGTLITVTGKDASAEVIRWRLP